MSQAKKPGFRDDAVSFVCPECNGPLYETVKANSASSTARLVIAFLPRVLRMRIRMRWNELSGSPSAP